MNTEQQKIEYKSLQKIRTGEKGFKELSTTCVALANAQGGQIMIGVEDKTKKPAPNQVIPQEEANSAVTRLRGLCFNVGLAVGDVCADETGSQYFAITVFPSLHSYATTSDGKMYIRVADKIVDLIGFFFLNLQRKILNIKVMKRILCVLIAAIWLCTCWAGNGKKPIVWEKPVAESNQLFNDPRQSQLNIYRVEFADDETRVDRKSVV